MPAPTITYELLRQIAETASGLRDSTKYFVVGVDHDGTTCFSWHDKAPPPNEDIVVIPVQGVADPAPRVRVAKIGTEKGRTVDLMRIHIHDCPPYPAGTYAADAVFWSVSALEKFVVPYYASVYGDDGPRHAQAVLDALLRPHLNGVEGEVPFAVAHLPSSEYVPVRYGDAVVPEVVALTSTGGHHITHPDAG